MIFLVLAVVCLVLAIYLFFRFRIPSVFGQLTGYSERKQISQMSKHNRFSEAFSPKLTQKIDNHTEYFSDNTNNETSLLSYNDDSNLGQNETSVLESNHTQLLNVSDFNNDLHIDQAEPNSHFIVEEAISFTESKEFIE